MTVLNNSHVQQSYLTTQLLLNLFVCFRGLTQQCSKSTPSLVQHSCNVKDPIGSIACKACTLVYWAILLAFPIRTLKSMLSWLPLTYFCHLSKVTPASSECSKVNSKLSNFAPFFISALPGKSCLTTTQLEAVACTNSACIQFSHISLFLQFKQKKNPCGKHLIFIDDINDPAEKMTFAFDFILNRICL